MTGTNQRKGRVTVGSWPFVFQGVLVLLALIGIGGLSMHNNLLLQRMAEDHQTKHNALHDEVESLQRMLVLSSPAEDSDAGERLFAELDSVKSEVKTIRSMLELPAEDRKAAAELARLAARHGKLSQRTDAAEVGQVFEVVGLFRSGNDTESLTVTIDRAAKYYPVEVDGHHFVYMPTCSDRGCDDGATRPQSVKSDEAIVGIDFKFTNDTTDETAYIRAYYHSRFVVKGEHRIPGGSKIVRNISTNTIERFSRGPDFYVNPLTTETSTFLTTVPRDLEEITFIYGEDFDDPTLEIDFRFDDRILDTMAR